MEKSLPALLPLSLPPTCMGQPPPQVSPSPLGVKGSRGGCVCERGSVGRKGVGEKPPVGRGAQAQSPAREAIVEGAEQETAATPRFLAKLSFASPSGQRLLQHFYSGRGGLPKRREQKALKGDRPSLKPM